MLRRITESPINKDGCLQSTFFFFLTSDQRRCFLGTSYKNTEPEVTDQPKVKAGLSHHSTQSDAMSVIYHHKHT